MFREWWWHKEKEWLQIDLRRSLWWHDKQSSNLRTTEKELHQKKRFQGNCRCGKNSWDQPHSPFWTTKSCLHSKESVTPKKARITFVCDIYKDQKLDLEQYSFLISLVCIRRITKKQEHPPGILFIEESANKTNRIRVESETPAVKNNEIWKSIHS